MSQPLLPPRQQGMFDYKTLDTVERSSPAQLKGTWLSTLGLKHLDGAAQAFLEHDVGGPDVVYLDNTDLKELIPTIGDRKKLLRSMHELKNAKVMEQKNRLIGKFFPWEPFIFCCLCERRTTPVIVLPMVIKFKSRNDLWSAERKTEMVEISQVQDMTVVVHGWSTFDYDIFRQCCGCPSASLTILADNETNHETRFVVRCREGKIVERLVRDAMEAAASGQSDMSHILADKRS
mmetsp:Transcript_26883/g.52657  ORF Transcript_26883/g.52657 Transcript_26883/m.52657 type:complete len:234 (+) Transcript_26883:59-760(+)